MRTPAQKSWSSVITQSDTHFRRHPQVSGEPRIRFLAASPIWTVEGRIRGVLCTADVVPRVLTSEQEEGLDLLARQLQARMELGEQGRKLQELVAEKDRLVTRLAASEELFRAFMNASPFLSYIKDEARGLVFYNRAFARRFAMSETAWLRRKDDDLWGRQTSTATQQNDIQLISSSLVERQEWPRDSQEPLTCWKTYTFSCHNSMGRRLLAGVAVDVTDERAHKVELERYQHELEGLNDQLRQLSVTDQLTGLRNRRALEERLTLEFSVARRRDRELSVLLIDVDHFKQINDKRGHTAEDTVLRCLDALLQSTIRLPDLVSRYGGEEFAVLLPECGTEAASGLQIA